MSLRGVFDEAIPCHKHLTDVPHEIASSKTPRNDMVLTEDEMSQNVSVQRIQALGFEWPKHAIIEEYYVQEHDTIDLTKTRENLQSSRAFYQGQINAAYAFKQQTGADYADFTDRRDDYVRQRNELDKAIAYIEEIMAAIPT